MRGRKKEKERDIKREGGREEVSGRARERERKRGTESEKEK